jgi:hypothetical protein
MGEKRNAYKLLMGKPEGKRPLERSRRRWVDNIKIYLGDVGWGDWIGLAQHSVGTQLSIPEISVDTQDS